MASIGAGAALLGASAGCSLASTETSEIPAGQSSAGNTPEWLGSPIEINSADIIDTKACDLLIIGAGNAGMSASATAADLGMDFIICEKRTAVQETRHWVGAVNSKWHKEAGVAINEGMLLNEMTRYASGRCDQSVWNVWIRESADTVEYLDNIMKVANCEIFLDTEGYDHDTGGTYYYAPPTQHMWYDQASGGPGPLSGVLASAQRNAVLEAHINSKGYEVSYEFELVKLLREGETNGKVTGAVFKTPDGYVQINANKAVLLTTGGYAANPVMMNALNPMTPPAVAMAQFSPRSTGEALKVAIHIGAAIDGAPAPMVFDRGYAKPGETAGYIGEGTKAAFRYMDGSGILLGSQPFMKVNRKGKRFFNESAPYDWSAFAASKQPGGVWCSIFDNRAATDVLNFKLVGCAKIGTMLLQSGPIDAVFENLINKGFLIKSDTLEDLADKLGLPKEDFLAEVERYNGFYKAGKDEDFGKEPFRLSSISEPPYYGFWCGGSLLTTLDGLRINANMQVLDDEDNVIERLYAAGDCSGSLYSGNYPEYIVGNACGRTLTFGRHAVRHIAEDTA